MSFVQMRFDHMLFAQIAAWIISHSICWWYWCVSRVFDFRYLSHHMNCIQASRTCTVLSPYPSPCLLNTHTRGHMRNANFHVDDAYLYQQQNIHSEWAISIFQCLSVSVLFSFHVQITRWPIGAATQNLFQAKICSVYFLFFILSFSTWFVHAVCFGFTHVFGRRSCQCHYRALITIEFATQAEKAWERMQVTWLKPWFLSDALPPPPRDDSISRTTSNYSHLL